MYQRTSIYKRISMVVGITTLMLGLIPVPVLSRVGMASADDSAVTEPAPVGDPLPLLDESIVQEIPVSDPVTEPLAEPPVDPVELAVAPEPLVVDPAAVPDGNALPPEGIAPIEELPASDSPVEEPAPEALVGDFSLMRFGAISMLSLSSAIGDDPVVANELPDFGNNYSNGDCVTNASCVTDEPVTNPNDYIDQGTYGQKDYTLPDIGGNTANIVAVKRGNEWFFFKVGSGTTCDETTFCVEFDGSGNVQVYSYQPQANGYLGYNMIHFWYVAPPIPGCMDQTATNYNPDATEDNGSCEYVVVIPGCMDQAATNYNPEATEDNGSCEFEQQRLGLTLNAVCTPGEGGYFLAWSVNNPNGFAVDATWDLNGSNGTGSLAPGTNFIGNTPTGSGSYTLNVSWGSGKASKSAQALCKPEIEKDPPDETTTTVVVQAPLVIPVTGADLDGEFPLFRRVMLLAGSVLLTSGMFMKGTTKKEKKLKK